MARTKHAHKYERVILGKGYTVFRCVLPDCRHYIRKELAEGKVCICNRCDSPMLLTKVAMTLRRPHCADCTKRKNAVKIEAVKSVLSEMFEGDENESITKLREQISRI